MKVFLRRALSSFAASALFLIAFAGLALAHGHGHHWGQWGHAPEIDPSLILGVIGWWYTAPHREISTPLMVVPW